MMDYVRTWKERIVGDMRTYAVDAAKNAEIDELRAALDANTRQIATLHAVIGELEQKLAAVEVTSALLGDSALPQCQCFTEQQEQYCIRQHKCQGKAVAYAAAPAAPTGSGE